MFFLRRRKARAGRPGPAPFGSFQLTQRLAQAPLSALDAPPQFLSPQAKLPGGGEKALYGEQRSNGLLALGKSPGCGGGRASRPAIPPNLSWDFARDLLSAAKAAWPCILWRAKPPNDLYIKDKKIAGILPEILDQGAGRALILGLGLNVFSHPAGIPNAGHLQGYEKSLAGVSPADVSRQSGRAFSTACMPYGQREPGQLFKDSSLPGRDKLRKKPPPGPGAAASQLCHFEPLGRETVWSRSQRAASPSGCLNRKPWLSALSGRARQLARRHADSSPPRRLTKTSGMGIFMPFGRTISESAWENPLKVRGRGAAPL